MATELASMFVITLKFLVTNDALDVISEHEMGWLLERKYGLGQLKIYFFLVVTY